MGGGTYWLIFAMHAAVWLVHGPGTICGYVFLQGGYGGSVMEIGGLTRPEAYCIVYPDPRD
jgi:hypothetical protein